MNGTARGSSVPGGWVVRLFPRAWRQRYGEELLNILELQPPSVRNLIDGTVLSIGGRQFGFFAQEAFWITSAFFGAVTLAIGVLPRAAALSLTIGAPLAMIGLFLGPSPEPMLSLAARVGVIMYGLGLIWLGLSVWTAHPRLQTSTA